MDATYFEQIRFLDAADSILSTDGAASTERLANAAGICPTDVQCYLLNLNRTGAVVLASSQLWILARD